MNRLPSEIFNNILDVNTLRSWPDPHVNWAGRSQDHESNELRKAYCSFQMVNKSWRQHLLDIVIQPDKNALRYLAENATESVILRELVKLQVWPQSGSDPVIEFDVIKKITKCVAKRGFSLAVKKIHDDFTKDDDVERVLAWRSVYPTLDKLEVSPYDVTQSMTGPLSYATINGNVPMVTALLEAGYTDEIYGIWERSAVGYAAELGHLDIARLLLIDYKGVASTSDWNDRPWLVAETFPLEPTEGSDALQIACLRGNVEMARLLIDCGADYLAEPEPSFEEDDGTRVIPTSGGSFGPLISAVESKSTEIVQLFLDKGADLNHMISDFKNTTPLMRAAEENLLPMAKFLLSKGADVNLQGTHTTALISAAHHGNPDMVRFLSDEGADINMVVAGKEAGSALAGALRALDVNITVIGGEEKYSECIEVLLDAGADVDATWRGKSRYSARAVAGRRGLLNILRLETTE